MLPARLLKDARYFQIIFPKHFLTYGIFVLHWKSETWLYATYFATSLIVQFACEWIGVTKHTAFRKIPERNSVGFDLLLRLSLLLKTHEPVAAILAATVSILF